MAKYGGKDFLIQRGYLSSGAWASTTAYTLGQVVVATGKVYECTTAGTSSSTAPTGTTDAVTDGTVVWRYIGAAVVEGTDTYGYKAIGGMRSNSMTINNEQVDVTTKSDVPWRQLLAVGIRSMSMSGSGIFSNDAVAGKMVQDATNGAIDHLRLVSGRGDSFSGDFLVASCERSGEYNQAEQFSLSFESAGTITYTAAP